MSKLDELKARMAELDALISPLGEERRAVYEHIRRIECEDNPHLAQIRAGVIILYSADIYGSANFTVGDEYVDDTDSAFSTLAQLFSCPQVTTVIVEEASWRQTKQFVLVPE